ncbi:sulfotransferase family protein [Owenweeksia hongkongensis DSM 17368]|uniref:Sulfotransferase family protein n=1 Tax=Owenweeksia hongkongensis (strain DSM 17368 / CIP 108786 / JCM 12287 / NRRL B-23963 / UST20020801) TaxID=926562 RepID=G8R513_OWEHD|nr:sulfotransferase [Owenweeksia hongkongensis]AEV34327.1 sulfotransferase family protein [Owenweeksia hongkongensis DSM 17368]
MITNDRLPDFLIIGAGKSGTTALCDFLSQHPEIFISKRKEPNFLAFEGVDSNSYDLEESRSYHEQSVVTLEKYLELFENAAENQVVGENSNVYLTNERTIPNIKKYVPNAKLIVILRHPADRLLSRYSHLVRINSVPTEGLDELFNRSSIWWRRQDLILEGFYGRYLERYYREFDKDLIKVIFYEDFKLNRGQVLKEVFEFLNVDGSFKADASVILNKSGRRKKNLFNWLLGEDGFLIKSSKKMSPKIHDIMKNDLFFKKQLLKWRNSNLETIKFSEDLRTRITDEIYREDIIKLENVTGRSLKDWF